MATPIKEWSKLENEVSTSNAPLDAAWLIGLDDDIAAPLSAPDSGIKGQDSAQAESKTSSQQDKNMDDPVEVKNDEGDVFEIKETEPEAAGTSPIVMVTEPSLDQGPPGPQEVTAGSVAKERDECVKDKTDGEKGKEGEGSQGKTEEKKLTVSVSSDISDKADSRHSSTSDMDMDFSVLELPGMAHLNFETSEHRRTLSKKGSISRRKKPSRAAIHTSKLASSEDSIYVDSTEPRLPKSLLAEDRDDDQEQTTKKREAEATPEESSSRPAKKVAGGVKIPGLLEGLMGSKRFNKGESKPTAARDEVPAGKPSPLKTTKPTASPFVPLLKPTNQSASADASTAGVSTRSKPSPPAPAPRPKPVALPHVLPSIPTRPLRDTKNQSKDAVKAGGSEQNSSSPSALSKPALKSTQSPDKPAPGIPMPGVRKDLKPVPAPSAAKDPKLPTPPTKNLSSLRGGTDFRKALVGPPDVKKKPPTPLKKPALKSKPEKSSSEESKAEIKPVASEKSCDNRSSDDKLEESVLFSSSVISDNQSSSQADRIDGSLAKSAPKETVAKGKSQELEKEEMDEDGFVLVEKSDYETESKSKESESKTSKTTYTIPSSQETSDTVLSSKSKSADFFPEEDFSFMADSDQFLSSKESLKSSSPTASSSFSTTTTSVSKSDMFTSSELKHDTSSTTVERKPSVPRKSSVSGVSSVKPPSSSDKSMSSPSTSTSPAGNMGRRDSITGSAYNPIGFRSALGSSDSHSESRSRGSSVSLDIKTRGDSVSSTGSDSSKKTPGLVGMGSSKGPADSVIKEKEDSKEEVTLRKKPEKPDSRPSWLSEANKNSLNQAKQRNAADKTKEAANEANKIIKDQGSLRNLSSISKTSAATTKSEIAPEEKKSSPWGVRLRKVDSPRPKSIAEPPNNENSTPGVSWRQQMSQKRQSYVPPKDAGIINSDAK
ncbi:hypothetical protein PoB_007297700 [Plakobranchus ocellatus]|uniref:Uncharacterized protein n=1 Tax=Plakobranchus ocellatus TaxID=259542 RepID=A0AAV4DQ59_9GAST|nr:hypothetical protein PoB_007297700 [Plakobranchus ocellatus]